MMAFIKALIAIPQIWRIGYSIYAAIKASRNERHYQDLVKWQEEILNAKTEDEYRKAMRNLRDRMEYRP